MTMPIIPGSSNVRSSVQPALVVAVVALVTIAGAALAAPLPLVGGIILVGLLTAVAAISPVGMLLGTIVTLPYFYRPLTIGSLEFAASELLLVAAAGGAILSIGIEFIRDPRTRSRIRRDVAAVARSRVVWFLVALVVLGALSLLWPFDPSARDASLREWRWSLAEPLALVVLLVVFARHREQRMLVAAALVFAGTLAAGHAMIDLATGGGVTADNVRRLSGPLPHPNAMALFLVRPFILVAGLFVFLDRWRWYLALPAGIMGLAVFATFSRGALIAVLFAVVILGLRAPRRVQLALGGAVVSVGALTAIVAGDRMRNLFEGGSVSLRLDIWSSALEMIRDRPVLGYGLDQFLYAYAPRYIQPTAWDERFTSHAHNLIADSWIRLGIVGAFLALFAILAVGRKLITVERAASHPDILGRAALLALAALLVHGMIDNAIFGHDLAMSAWLLAWLTFARNDSSTGDQVADG